MKGPWGNAVKAIANGFVATRRVSAWGSELARS